jgi:acetyltransferase-like isoleucine patch superfamily enzyme
MRHTEPVPTPVRAAPLPLRRRVAALHSELGPAGVAAIAWSRAWMALAGLPIFGRVAVRLAAAACRPYYGRHRLARYHPRGFVAPGARLSHRGLRLGRNVFVAEGVVVYADAGGGPVTLGDRVHLNERVTIVTANGGSVSFGDDTHVQPGCYFMAVQGSIRIGQNVQIAPNCAFYPYEHATELGLPMRLQPIRTKGDIDVGDDAWLGYGVVVLQGVSIGEGTVVGAGSVVTKSLPSSVVAAGSPARVVHERA